MAYLNPIGHLQGLLNELDDAERIRSDAPDCRWTPVARQIRAEVAQLRAEVEALPADELDADSRIALAAVRRRLAALDDADVPPASTAGRAAMPGKRTAAAARPPESAV